MNTLQRLKAYMDAKGISNGTAEKACGFGNATLRNAFESGKGIGSDKVEKILSIYTDLSAEWLFRGTGSMFVGGGKARELEDKITMICDGRDREKAYDMVITMLDFMGKTNDFYK